MIDGLEDDDLRRSEDRGTHAVTMRDLFGERAMIAIAVSFPENVENDAFDQMM
ncbi:MAG: hypothetical protein OXF07_01680 [Rhodobacter sp.]|nr:hypothetical protein [Rhodobacter sp.]MCY4168725.1 hypothetical protein [Rhodobacter sp.]MCY4240220.1 hypothetical protein [Rhodobacter sp.]